jgi:LytS/YehU family sensor histidine kinase
VNRFETHLDFIFIRRRWMMHIAYWVIILLFYTVFFGRKNNNYIQTLFFVGLLMPIVIGITYLFNYYLIPHFLMVGRYGVFFLYSCYTILTSLFLEMMVALLTFLVIAGLKIQNMSPASLDILFLLSSLLVVVFLGVAIKLLLYWRQSKEDYQVLMRDKAETELKFLKAQLNPHFLFNTLNNLYFLTTEKSDKAPQAILQLSEMLDYAMHSDKIVFVSLEKELSQVENYVDLEMLRYQDRVEVSKQLNGDYYKFKVPPMLIVTLIENAFKHGVMSVANKSWIKWGVDVRDNELFIFVSNSKQESKTSKGIGLNNLRSQIDYLYPNNYVFEIIEDQNEFSVNLRLPRKE